MGLACSNIRLLTLTARKADCEYNISIDSMEKMALTREQSALSREYYARLQNKNICYYADGKYNNINYQYIMGYNSYDKNFGTVTKDALPLKDDNSMVLADSNGRVVMNNAYRSALVSVLGQDCVDAAGRGKPFSMDKIPALIAAVCGMPSITEDEIEAVINDQKVMTSFGVTKVNTLTGEEVGTDTKESEKKTDKVQQVVDFYYPIFVAAAANGWTSEYNQDMGNNDRYISDALVSGFFQLQQVNPYGAYDPDASLTYFCLEGLVIDRQDSDKREEITAWYNAEKERIAEKENWLDIEITDLSTELEAINTEMESIKSYIDDDIQTSMNWGNS
ncbi:hypothetical protein IKQ21_06570 [bacterium]|nr:hypothetical protein [bacterium]